MRLKRGVSTRRPADHSKTTTRGILRGARLGWGVALVLLVAAGTGLWMWQGRFHGVAVQPPPLPANLDQMDADVATLIRSKAQRVQAVPRDAAAYGDLGLVYEANGLWKDAREAYVRAVQLQPDASQWRLRLAIATQEVGDFPAAVAEFRAAVDADPNSASAQQRLGYALLEIGELDAARRAFERVIELQPQAAEGYVGVGGVWLRQGDAARAAEALEKALAIDPQYPVTHHLLGTAYGQLGRDQDAAEHLALGSDANIRYLPDDLQPRLAQYAVNVRALVSTGGKQLADGQTEQAIQTLERVLRAEPTNVSAMNNLAIAYVRQQRPEDAHQLLLKALEIDPNKYLTYINLANWAKLSGDETQALEFVDQAIERAPQVDIPHRTRAVYLAQMGRLDEALASASQAATLNPRDPRTQALCADLCMRVKRFSEAVGYFRTLTQLSPQRVDGWVGLAQANLSQGNIEQAQQALGQALKLAPGHPEVGKAMERLEAQKTRIEAGQE